MYNFLRFIIFNYICSKNKLQLKKSYYYILLFCLIGFVFLSFKTQSSSNISDIDTSLNIEEQSVQDVLVHLGDDKPLHYIPKIDKDSMKMGYEMVYFGQLKDKSNKRISKFFVCTDCHNQVKEVEDLNNETADERLKYAKINHIPYLPASTFYGEYNKEHWYNGDYEKKYGDLVKPTRDTLANAIQLCAVQCSQGRALEFWEIRCILHYYKSIEFKIKDLNLTAGELKLIDENLGKPSPQLIKMIKSKYNPINPATFGDPYVDIEKYPPGDIENGAYIFKEGCLHCHAIGKDITAFEFDDNQLTLSFLNKKLKKHSHYSVPYIVRKGTYAVLGKKQYMPQYPLEKMSDAQLIDLITYIKSKSE